MSEPQAPVAARRPSRDMLIDVDRLIAAYHDTHPDPGDPAQAVSFGTSGHRGSAPAGTFNEDHIVAISAAIARHRVAEGISGPLFIGRDTHALSLPAFRTAVEVLVAAGVQVAVDSEDGFTPTPAVSNAILTANAVGDALADGIVITPSHNPPEDGGFKYNPPHGGPADTDATRWIEDRSNALLAAGVSSVSRTPYEKALRADVVHAEDFVTPYVTELATVVD